MVVSVNTIRKKVGIISSKLHWQKSVELLFINSALILIIFLLTFRLRSISTVWAHRTRHFSDFQRFYKNTPSF